MKKLAVALALLLPAAGLAQVPPVIKYTIPGVVNAGGLNNTRFVSDLALTNPGSSSASVLLSFVPEGSLDDIEVSLSGGKTIVWRNILQQLWGGSETAGAVVIRSDQPLLVRARTYNTAAGGTYGVALPVYESDAFLLPGESAQSLWVSQSPDPGAGYRTNIAVLFPDAGGGQATVTVFDTDGRSLGQQNFSLASAGFQQFGVGSFAGAAPVARAEIQVSRGHAAGYSVVVDNVTGDSSLFTFEALPGGTQDVLVNGVARANGRNDTFFRTDGRFFNPGATDATVTVAFHANQNSNASPVTRDFVVPAGKMRDVVDVLDSLLGLPVGSAGALRFTSNSAVAILCRTSNVDPTGVKPGTFGAQQKPRPMPSFLMSADTGAVVTGIRQNATFRTNIGFAAGGDGAIYSLTLKSTTGSIVATASGSLGPFGWTQPNIADIFPGTTVPGDATLFVRVTSGSVDVFDSSIDNASGDPVVTPIMPLPADIPSAATIGPEGGSVRSDDGRLTVKVPAGALSLPASVSLQTAPNIAPDGVGAGYSLAVGGATFTKAPLASLRYGAKEIVGSGPEHLLLAYQSAGTLYGLGDSTRDTSTRTLWTRLVGAPFGPKSTLSSGSRETLRKDAGPTIVPILDFKVSPGKAGVLAGRLVPMKMTGTFLFKDGTLKPVELGVDTTWELLPSGSAPGSLVADGGTATYVAPTEVSCVEPVRVRYQHRNFDGVVYRGYVEITLLPRVWELHASALVKADLCKVAGDSPRFSLATDLVMTVMTLVENPAGNGFQFIQSSPGSIISKGSLGSAFPCSSKGCTDSWRQAPGTDLRFYGGTGTSGGWNNEAGGFYLEDCGLILGNAIPYEWGNSCPSRTSQGLLPNVADVDPYHVQFNFPPPDPENECTTEVMFTWQEFRDWTGVPITKKDMYYGTEFRLRLVPK